MGEELPEERVKSRILELLPIFEETNQTLESLGLDDLSAASMLIGLEDKYDINFDELCQTVSRRESSDEPYDHKLTLTDILSYMAQQRKTEPVAAPYK